MPSRLKADLPFVALLAAMLLATAAALQPPAGGRLQALPDPHGHVVGVTGLSLEFEDLRVVEAAIPPGWRRDNSAINPGGTLEAFSGCAESGPRACRLFISDREAARTYELQGFGLSWRPFSDLVWIDERILVFDQWAQPHYGVHYAFDYGRRECVVAAGFPDELP